MHSAVHQVLLLVVHCGSSHRFQRSHLVQTRYSVQDLGGVVFDKVCACEGEREGGRESAVARVEAQERSEHRGCEIPPNRHERFRCLIVITKVFAEQP